MLDLLDIKNFKCIEEQVFGLKPLTIVTGLNSTGKSTVIQSILLLSSVISNNSILQELVKKYSSFNEVRNKYVNLKNISLYIKEDYFDVGLTIFPKNESGLSMEYHNSLDWKSLEFEKNLFYISSNRIGQEDIAPYDENIRFGTNGKYVFGYFEQNKDKVIFNKLIKYDDLHTLDAQVSYWLNYILDIDLRVVTSKITNTYIKVTFNSDGLEDISPFNLGAGNSYLAKILIMGLSLKKNNIFIIENPEIHLHPKAQARLNDFFIMLVNAGIQIVVETHSEHFINKLRYNTYKDNILKDKSVIFYKKSIRDKFEVININQNGHFVNEESNEINFPTGFFDSTLDELMEIM